MKTFWMLYMRQFSDYPSVCSDALEAVKDFAFALFALTLPLTFPIIYPAYVLYTKLKRDS